MGGFVESMDVTIAGANYWPKLLGELSGTHDRDTSGEEVRMRRDLLLMLADEMPEKAGAFLREHCFSLVPTPHSYSTPSKTERVFFWAVSSKIGGLPSEWFDQLIPTVEIADNYVRDLYKDYQTAEQAWADLLRVLKKS